MVKMLPSFTFTFVAPMKCEILFEKHLISGIASKQREEIDNLLYKVKDKPMLVFYEITSKDHCNQIELRVARFSNSVCNYLTKDQHQSLKNYVWKILTTECDYPPIYRIVSPPSMIRYEHYV
jgi:hypothetical protein